MRRIGAATALLFAGCSLGFVAGPPPEHAALPSFSCSDSRVAPVLDTVLASLAGLTALSAAGSTDAMWEMNNNRLGSRADAIALFAPLAALEAASAYYGYTRVHACVEARQQALARVQTRLPGMQPIWPPAAMTPAPAPPAPRPR
ncbi:MAG TPA: hypothetical protein VHT91_19930 [Kofleriaceae bacterium]|jgi:hypothetical protein|nr:hypothetical protein [Kofleriaceae bacterium]